MASVTPNEKADALGLTVQTHALSDKPSQDTLSSDMPSAEKSPQRLSDVSTTHHANPFDTDIEAIITTNTENRNISAQCTRGGPECQVWPGQDHWRRKAKAAKNKRRNCNCLAHLSKRNRIIVKVLIGLLVIGIAVGVGVGISKPLGARIWHPNDH
ncbi:hypothetical protein BR93DRAFT_477716 [Coniochaeta sp. PMI_546]|nr:hypothetical protein BR93DRAFT_477716 [Coniochaeta sp. PMI_546]